MPDERLRDPLPPLLAACVVRAGLDLDKVVDWQFTPADMATTEPARLAIRILPDIETVEITVTVDGG